ncbi:MAG: hypothetical protein ACOC9J_00225, partial [Persicimonas sp.]
AGVSPDIITYSTLIKAFGDAGQPERAWQVYETMLEDPARLDEISYNILIRVLGDNGQPDRAWQVYERLGELGLDLNVVTYSILIKVFGDAGQPERAWKVYRAMLDDAIEPNVITYSTLIKAFGDAGQPERALEMLELMERRDIEPNAIAYNSLIKAFGDMGQPERAYQLYRQMVDHGLEADVITFSTLIKTFGDAGRPDRALEVYEEMPVMAPFYKAQQQYFDYLWKHNRDWWFVLDPVITVHPDEIFYECFSEDESTYARLSCGHEVFTQSDEFACGTTNIDYSADLYDEFQKIRSYKETELTVDPDGFSVQTGEDEGHREVKIDLPDSWVRGFLQVSSAMNLPGFEIDLHPMDLHNICFKLRLLYYLGILLSAGLALYLAAIFRLRPSRPYSRYIAGTTSDVPEPQSEFDWNLSRFGSGGRDTNYALPLAILKEVFEELFLSDLGCWQAASDARPGVQKLGEIFARKHLTGHAPGEAERIEAEVVDLLASYARIPTRHRVFLDSDAYFSERDLINIYRRTRRILQMMGLEEEYERRTRSLV